MIVTPMIVTWLKFVHLAAIALWSAGLLTLPFLYRQRRGLAGEPLHRLHNFTRFFYVRLVSPGAFVAIATGTVLIFFQGTYDLWFAGKLFFVGVMAGLHLLAGMTILKLFEPGERYPLWRFALTAPLALIAIGGVLVLVLGKPRIELPGELAALLAPGALSRLVLPLIGAAK
ncbi:MAG: CopD family protein [Devosia sp.]